MINLLFEKEEINMFRRISDPYLKEPVGQTRMKDGYLVDSNNDVFEKNINGYVKIGYISEFAGSFEKTLKTFTSFGLGVLIWNTLFPARSRKNSEADTGANIVMFGLMLIVFVITIYSLVIGYIMNKVAQSKVGKIADYLEDHITARYFVPNYWFTDTNKISGLFYVGLPLLIVLEVVYYLFNYIFNQDFLVFLLGLNSWAIGISLISMLWNIILNSLSKVNKL